MYYVNNTEEYFTTSNTTFLFLEGEHVLQQNGTFIEDISDLTLTHDVDNDSNASQATVMCSGSGGFSFSNITNLKITGLRLVGCSKHSQNFRVFVAVEMSLIFNLEIFWVSIHNTTGFGLMTDGLFGTATIRNITIDLSHSVSYAYGGNFAIYCKDWQFLNYSTNHSLTVSDSQFLYGTNKYNEDAAQASGIYVHIDCHVSMNITFHRISVKGNVATEGGNMGILYISNSSQWTVIISILNSIISDGYAEIGGGLFMTAVATSGDKGSKVITIFKVINTTFSQNQSPTLGGGVYFRLHENYVSTIGLFTFQDCTFSENEITSPYNDFEEHGGVAVHVLTYLRPDYEKHLTPLFNVSFVNCTFSHNTVQYPPPGGRGNLSSRNGAFFVQNVKSLSLQNCTFINNSCAGVIAINSNLLLRDWNHIQNNKGTRGGGMVFCAGSLMHLYTGTILNITQNTATQYGGGIYVEDDCTQVIPYCFFQVDNATANSSALNKTNVNLINNTAGLAGSALYGGLVDSCTLIDKVFARHYPTKISSKVFDATFYIESSGSSSNISSDPMQVCFCNFSNCSNQTEQTEYIVPGATFQVSVVLKGQRNGFVPGVVDAQCSDNCILGERQKSQLVDNQTCSALTYTIFADENTTHTLNLVAEDSYYEYTGLHGIQPSITLYVGRCPLGFKVKDQSCKCILSEVDCNISSKTITRRPPYWIGYTSIPPKNMSDIIFHKFCPLGYCHDRNVTIRTNSTFFDQDAQCVQNRHGLLCGSCKQNYSLGFGSYDCMPCASNTNALRAAGLVIVCALAGILLVLLLTLLNLTVSEGTLNGLIFYANIVQVNSEIFFSSESHARFLATFIAWLNLDFGIKVCFVDGMDEYTKTWLQFVFPLYIWLISGAIVYFSWNYNTVARLVGKNAVKVLATLFLLSFGKLLRTIIAAVAYTLVESPTDDIRTIVWLHDAKVHYLQGKHIVLFVFAIIASILTLMYTFSLLFIQCLRKLSGTSVFPWVERLKPLFDAYTGPYKDKYHFWTGLLLLARIFLFVCFTLNATNNPTLNLTLIIMVCSMLMVAMHVQVYRHVVLGLLENFMYLNLILFSTTLILLLQIKHAEFKPAAAYTFGGLVLLAFFGIVAYHAYKRVFGTQRFGQLKVWCQEKRWTKQVARIQPVVIPRDDSEESDESDAANEMDSFLEDDPSMDATQLREPLIGSIQ